MKLVLTALLLLVATPSFAGITCFWKDQVRNFDAKDNTHLTVYTMRDSYTLELTYCRDIDFAYRIGFDSFSSNVCQGDSVLVFDGASNRIVDRCHILNVTKN